MGAFIFGLATSYFVYIFYFFLIKKYRQKWMLKIRDSKLMKAMKSTRLLGWLIRGLSN